MHALKSGGTNQGSSSAKNPYTDIYVFEMFHIGWTLPFIMFNIGNEMILFGNAGPQHVQSYSLISRIGLDSPFKPGFGV